MRLSLFIPTTPQPKQRARVPRDGHAYTPEPTVTAEDAIKVAWLAAHRYTGLAAWGKEVPVALYLTVWLRRPAGSNRPLPSVRPDDDNYRKLLSDALNGVAFFDDGQITTAVTEKRYCDEAHPSPGWDIVIETDPALANMPMADGERAVLVRTSRPRKES